MYYSIISSFLSLSEQRLSTSSTTSVLRFPKKPSIVVISFFACLVHGNAGSGGAGEDPRPGPRRMVRSVMDGFVSSEVDIRLLWYRLSSYCAVLYLKIDAQALSSGLPFFFIPFSNRGPADYRSNNSESFLPTRQGGYWSWSTLSCLYYSLITEYTVDGRRLNTKHAKLPT